MGAVRLPSSVADRPRPVDERTAIGAVEGDAVDVTVVEELGFVALNLGEPTGMYSTSFGGGSVVRTGNPKAKEAAEAAFFTLVEPRGIEPLTS